MASHLDGREKLVHEGNDIDDIRFTHPYVFLHGCLTY